MEGMGLGGGICGWSGRVGAEFFLDGFRSESAGDDHIRIRWLAIDHQAKVAYRPAIPLSLRIDRSHRLCYISKFGRQFESVHGGFVSVDCRAISRGRISGSARIENYAIGLVVNGIPTLVYRIAE